LEESSHWSENARSICVHVPAARISAKINVSTLKSKKVSQRKKKWLIEKKEFAAQFEKTTALK
jgi:hypothetical protein